MFKNKRIAFKLTFYILLSCIVIFFLIFGYNYFFSLKLITKSIEENAKNLTLIETERIESEVLSIEKIPQSIAYILENIKLENFEIINLLKTAVRNNPEIFGMSICYEPYAFKKDLKFFAPYFYMRDNVLKKSNDEKFNYFYMDWYQISKELNKPVWSEPYFDNEGGYVMMSTYSVPFYKTINGTRKFIGLVTADVSLSNLQTFVSSIKVANTGYGFVISANGVFITHPIKNFIMNETIFSLASEINDKNLYKIGRNMLEGKSGFVQFNNVVNNKKSWLMYRPLSQGSWALGVVFPQDELISDITTLNFYVFILGIIGIILVFVVVVFISRLITNPLNILAKATTDIASGNLDFEIPNFKTKDEVSTLAENYVFMRDSLKKYIHDLTEATAERERIESELRIAWDIQISQLPKIFPPFPEKKEIDIFSLMKPAKEVGGDFYDFFFISDDLLLFVIGDVAGKGIPGAVMMVVVKTLIKAAASEYFGTEEIMNIVNRQYSDNNDTCMFVTIFCGILNIKTGEISYTNAGHNPPLIRRSNGTTAFIKGAGAAPIGIDEDLKYFSEKIKLEKNDIIIMYTDGVTEAFNKNNELFSPQRLENIISGNEYKSIKDTAECILSNIESFSTGMPQSDDITIQVVVFNGNAN